MAIYAPCKRSNMSSYVLPFTKKLKFENDTKPNLVAHYLSDDDDDDDDDDDNFYNDSEPCDMELQIGDAELLTIIHNYEANQKIKWENITMRPVDYGTTVDSDLEFIIGRKAATSLVKIIKGQNMGSVVNIIINGIADSNDILGVFYKHFCLPHWPAKPTTQMSTEPSLAFGSIRFFNYSCYDTYKQNNDNYADVHGTERYFGIKNDGQSVYPIIDCARVNVFLTTQCSLSKKRPVDIGKSGCIIIYNATKMLTELWKNLETAQYVKKYGKKLLEFNKAKNEYFVKTLAKFSSKAMVAYIAYNPVTSASVDAAERKSTVFYNAFYSALKSSISNSSHMVVIDQLIGVCGKTLDHSVVAAFMDLYEVCHNRDTFVTRYWQVDDGQIIPVSYKRYPQAGDKILFYHADVVINANGDNVKISSADDEVPFNETYTNASISFLRMLCNKINGNNMGHATEVNQEILNDRTILYINKTVSGSKNVLREPLVLSIHSVAMACIILDKLYTDRNHKIAIMNQLEKTGKIPSRDLPHYMNWSTQRKKIEGEKIKFYIDAKICVQSIKIGKMCATMGTIVKDDTQADIILECNARTYNDDSCFAHKDAFICLSLPDEIGEDWDSGISAMSQLVPYSLYRTGITHILAIDYRNLMKHANISSPITSPSDYIDGFKEIDLPFRTAYTEQIHDSDEFDTIPPADADHTKSLECAKATIINKYVQKIERMGHRYRTGYEPLDRYNKRQESRKIKLGSGKSGTIIEQLKTFFDI